MLNLFFGSIIVFLCIRFCVFVMDAGRFQKNGKRSLSHDNDLEMKSGSRLYGAIFCSFSVVGTASAITILKAVDVTVMSRLYYAINLCISSVAIAVNVFDDFMINNLSLQSTIEVADDVSSEKKEISPAAVTRCRYVADYDITSPVIPIFSPQLEKLPVVDFDLTLPIVMDLMSADRKPKISSQQPTVSFSKKQSAELSIAIQSPKLYLKKPQVSYLKKQPVTDVKPKKAISLRKPPVFVSKKPSVKLPTTISTPKRTLRLPPAKAVPTTAVSHASKPIKTISLPAKKQLLALDSDSKEQSVELSKAIPTLEKPQVSYAQKLHLTVAKPKKAISLKKPLVSVSKKPSVELPTTISTPKLTLRKAPAKAVPTTAISHASKPKKAISLLAKKQLIALESDSKKQSVELSKAIPTLKKPQVSYAQKLPVTVAKPKKAISLRKPLVSVSKKPSFELSTAISTPKLTLRKRPAKVVPTTAVSYASKPKKAISIPAKKQLIALDSDFKPVIPLWRF